MKKVGDVYTKNEINYLVVDNDLIRKFKVKGIDAYYNHNNTIYSLGMSNNTVDVSNVTNISWLFYHRHNFNADISGWDVSNVTDMRGLASNAYNFNANISEWDVSNVTNMHTMFYDAHNFNADISNWDVNNVTDMNNMFHNAFKFNIDLSKWDVNNVKKMRGMFDGKRIKDINNHNIPKWYTDRHPIKLTISQQKEILEEHKDLPDEDKKAILKIVSLGLDWFYYKDSDFIII